MDIYGGFWVTEEKKRPLRTCIGCRQVRTKERLIRIVRTPEGRIEIDPQRRKSGRGAYLCIDKDCLRRAQKTRGLARALKGSIPAEIYAHLEEEINRLGDK